jgi:hypothetical protein
MASGLDPQAQFRLKYASEQQKREDQLKKINSLEPPFPWKVQSFDPWIFSLPFIPQDRPKR